MGLYAYPYEMSAHLIVSDEDAADFLQSQFSNDLRPFDSGKATYGLWLDVKGKIVADGWVVCEEDERFRVFSERCDAQSIRDKLEKHIIADDVEVATGEPLPALALIGEGAEAASPGAGDPWFSFPGRRANAPSVEMVFADAASRDAWVQACGGEIVSENWIQEERMKAGAVAIPGEVLPGDMPGEAGLVGDAVSLNKGCFLGQEVVARMHNVGRPQRALYLLSGEGEPPETPCPLQNDAGKALGELRTALSSGAGWRGVAMLKSRFAETGMPLAFGDRSAVVERFYSNKS